MPITETTLGQLVCSGYQYRMWRTRDVLVVGGSGYLGQFLIHGLCNRSGGPRASVPSLSAPRAAATPSPLSGQPKALSSAYLHHIYCKATAMRFCYAPTGALHLREAQADGSACNGCCTPGGSRRTLPRVPQRTCACGGSSRTPTAHTRNLKRVSEKRKR